MAAKKPVRKPPVKSAENPKKPVKKEKPTSLKKQFDQQLKTAINAKFGLMDADVEMRKLWEVEGRMRYRVNWWGWEEAKIIKSEFIHVAYDDGKITIV